MSELVIFLPQILSAAVSVSVGIVAWRRRKVPGAVPLGWLAFTEAEWSLALLGQMLSKDLSAKLFWDNFQYIGAVFTPLACLGFAIEYNSSRKTKLGFPWKSLSIISFLILGFIWTDGLHELFRIQPRILPGAPVDLLIYEPGPAFGLYSIYAYVLISTTFVLLLVNMINASPIYRPQVGLFLAGMLIPWLPGLINQTALAPINFHQITPVTFGLSNILIAWSLFRYRLLEIIPVARAMLIENISDGVIVLDIKGVIVDFNPSAANILRLPADELVGQPISSLIELPEGFLVCDDIRLTKKTELTRAGPGASEIYEIELRQLRVGDRVAAGFLLVMHNITEQKNTEANIRRNIALLEAAIQSSTNGVIVIDSDLSVVLYNRRLSAILELPERWEQMTDTEKINELAYCYQEPQLLYNEIEELIKNPADQRLTTFETIRGRALDCFISPYQVGQEKPGWLFSYQDVTEQKVAEDKLRHLAITDSLTHVFNRRHFFTLAQAELDRSKRFSRDISFILFDIDHFKSINDSFGHLIGDQVLEMLASYCKSNLRSFDVIGRFGGEEFIVLLPETSLKRAAQIAERLRKQALAIQIPTAKGTASITISLGVTGISGSETATLDQLINTADQACYQAKAYGRNQVCAFNVRDSTDLN